MLYGRETHPWRKETSWEPPRELDEALFAAHAFVCLPPVQSPSVLASRKIR